MDVAIAPREDPAHGHGPGPWIAPSIESRIAVFSHAAASGIGFLRDAHEVPSGLAAFDAVYQVLAGPDYLHQPPVDASLAQRLLIFPADAIPPRSVLAWRDPFGFQMQARLPAPANWATVCHLVTVAEELCIRMPRPVTSLDAPPLIDRVIGRILGS
jgi:hypothetical protein